MVRLARDVKILSYLLQYQHSKSILVCNLVWFCVLAGVVEAGPSRSKSGAAVDAVFMGPGVAVNSVEKLDSSLSMLAATHEVLGSGKSLVLAEDMGLVFDGEMVEVILEPESKGRADTIPKDLIYGLGGIVTGQSKSLLRVKLPLWRLEEAAATLAKIRLIRPPARPSEDAVSSVAVGLTGANTWQSAGYDGAGVKVAVIDLGFNGLSSAVSNGDIPASYIGRDETGSGLETGTVHGTGVSEAVCDMAPSVQLYCIKIGDEVDLENAKDYCVSEGIEIINHSVSWITFSNFDGSGLICGIASGANSNGILWVNSAGNAARQHCQTDFTTTGYTLDYTSIRSGAVDKPFTNFPETTYPARMYLTYRTAGTNMQCFLTWDGWSESGQDYDLFLYMAGEGWIIGSIRDQISGESPWEAISFTVPSTGWYAFGVTKYSASRNHGLNLFVSSYDSAIEPDDALNRIEAGSCKDPAVSPNVFAVGAIDSDNWGGGPQESFSSQGPTNGGVTKPDISGPDDCDSFIYGRWKGTSQSSPYVVGAAALVKEAFPSYTNAQIRSFLENRAVDLGAAGKDNIYGWGKLSLGAAPLLTYSISGVVSFDGSGLGGVTMAGLPSSPVSDVNGEYSDTVNHDWSGTVEATKTGYIFEPTNIAYTNVTSNQTNQDYEATSVIVLSDNFDDNRRGSMWRPLVDDCEQAWLVENSNLLNLRASGDTGGDYVTARYASNGWGFDVAEDFSVEVDFHYSAIASGDGWAEILIASENIKNNYVSILAGCASYTPYFYYEEVVDGSTVSSGTIGRASNDGTFYISYDASADELYLSYTGYGASNAWQSIDGVVGGQWAGEPVDAAIGGGSYDAVIGSGEGLSG